MGARGGEKCGVKAGGGYSKKGQGVGTATKMLVRVVLVSKSNLSGLLGLFRPALMMVRRAALVKA